MMIYRLVHRVTGLILQEAEFDLKSIQSIKELDELDLQLGFDVEEKNVHAYTKEKSLLKVKFFVGDKVINKFNRMEGVVRLGKTTPINSTTPFWGFYVEVSNKTRVETYSLFDAENECAWVDATSYQK